MEQQNVHEVYAQREYRRPGFFKIFVGLFLLFLGIVFLLQNIGLVNPVDVQMFFATIWPIVIIFFGLSILSRGGRVLYVISILIAVGLMVLAVAFLLNPIKYRTYWRGTASGTQLQPLY